MLFKVWIYDYGKYFWVFEEVLSLVSESKTANKDGGDEEFHRLEMD